MRQNHMTFDKWNDKKTRDTFDDYLAASVKHLEKDVDKLTDRVAVLEKTQPKGKEVKGVVPARLYDTLRDVIAEATNNHERRQHRANEYIQGHTLTVCLADLEAAFAKLAGRGAE